MFWDSFAQDPRDPAYAGLRASDRDRGLVADLISEAFADGRLSQDDYDSRQSAALRLVTLGEIPPLTADLIAAPLPPAVLPPDVHKEAVRKVRTEVIGTASGLAGPPIICTLIWVFSSPGDYFWPMWVWLGCAVPVILEILGIPGSISSTERRLNRKRWDQD
jgi:hypothetical protein